MKLISKNDIKKIYPKKDYIIESAYIVRANLENIREMIKTSSPIPLKSLNVTMHAVVGYIPIPEKKNSYILLIRKRALTIAFLAIVASLVLSIFSSLSFSLISNLHHQNSSNLILSHDTVKNQNLNLSCLLDVFNG